MAELTEFQKSLIRQIDLAGPMSMASFMVQCVHHYYNTRDPFGAAGDFTTAPEISQLFGEMIGAWLVNIWQQIGSPDRIALIEAGPGRGTLMADILRVFSRLAPKCTPDIFLIEGSEILKGSQQKTLANYTVEWAQSIHDIDTASPVFFIANEFLDALPIHQYKKTNKGWGEHCVAYKDDFILTEKPVPLGVDAEEGAVLELSPAREQFCADVADLLKQNKGAGLFVDYGDFGLGTEPTLQAVKGHKSVSVTQSPGEVDITSHVDFGACIKPFEALDPFYTTQAQFLESCGIKERAVQLGLQDEYIRLTNPDKMGVLFKVMGAINI